MSNTTLNSQLLSLVLSFRSGEKRAFNTIFSLLERDRQVLIHRYTDINSPKGDFETDFDAASQEGLWTAVLTFDEEKGTFRSYARSCMENAIKAVTKEGFSVIGVKTHVQEDISRINKAEKRLFLEGISSPTLEELSSLSGIRSPKTLKSALAAREAQKLTFLDKTFGEEGEEDSFLSSFPDEEARTEEAFVAQEKARALLSSLRLLPKVDQTILILTYGLYDYKKCTNKEIGRKVGLSEVSVIHHKEKALQILREYLADWAA